MPFLGKKLYLMQACLHADCTLPLLCLDESKKKKQFLQKEKKTSKNAAFSTRMYSCCRDFSSCAPFAQYSSDGLFYTVGNFYT